MMQAHAIATRRSAEGGHDHGSTSSPLAGGVVAATQALGKRKHAVEDCTSPRKCLALPAPGTHQDTVHTKHRTAGCKLTHDHQESAHSAPSQDRRRRSSSSGDEPSSATALDCDLMQRPSITTANAANAAATAAAAAALEPPTMADSCVSTRSDAAGPGPSAGARDRAGAATGGGGSAGVAARAAAAVGAAPCPADGGCTNDDVAQRRLARMEVVVEELVGQVQQLQRELWEQREVGQQMARALHSVNTTAAPGKASSLRGMSTPSAAPTSPTKRQRGQEGQQSVWVEEQVRAAAEECVASVKSQLRAFAERAISGLQQQVQAQCEAASKYVTSASTLCERLEGVRMAAEQQCAALQGYVAEITGAVRSSGNGNAAASRASPAAGAGVRPGSTHSSPTATKAGGQSKPASPGRTSPSSASAHKAAAAVTANASVSAPSSTTAAARSQTAAAASAAAPGFNSSAQPARPAPGAPGASAGPKPSSPVPQASARPHTSSALTSTTLASAPQASHASTYSNAASLSPVLPLFAASAVPGMHGASASSLSVGMGDTYQLSDGALLLLARVALGAPAPVNV